MVNIVVLDVFGEQVKEGDWSDEEVARGLVHVAGLPEIEAEAVSAGSRGEPEEAGGEKTITWAGNVGFTGMPAVLGLLGLVALVVVGAWTTIEALLEWLR